MHEMGFVSSNALGIFSPPPYDSLMLHSAQSELPSAAYPVWFIGSRVRLSLRRGSALISALANTVHPMDLPIAECCLGFCVCGSAAPRWRVIHTELPSLNSPGQAREFDISILSNHQVICKPVLFVKSG